MSSPRAPHIAPRKRKRSAVVGLGVGWLLVAAWVALLAWNLANAGPGAPLSRLIALPAIPALPLAPTLAAQAATSLAALMIALLLYLIARIFAPRPAVEAKPEPPAAPTPPAPAISSTQPRPALANSSADAAAGRPAFTPLVFISHSSRDDAFGKRLNADLRAALAPGLPGQIERVWYDSAPERGEEDPSDVDAGADAAGIAQPGGLVAGMNFPREIVEQIAMRNAVVVILSPEAARSRWVRYEIDLAINRYTGPERFAIYPIIYRACALPRSLAIFQTLDFTQADADPISYQRQLDELVARIREGRVALSESAPPFDLGLLPEPPLLIGRDVELEWTLARLRAHETTAVTALRGMGGIGKSALAAVAIRRLRQERAFPDGIVVVLCEKLTDPVEVLRQALTRFTPGRRPPAANDLPSLAAIAQELLVGKRALITLDNIEPDWPIEQVTGPLTATGVTLLLTARQMLPDTAAPPAGVRRLGLLSSDDALLLFAQNYGRADADTLTADERLAAARIVALLDHHTLAVRLAGAYAAFAASEYQRPLARVADEIASDLLRIPEGETPRKVEAVLARSVDALPPDGQRLFAALAAFATGEFGHQAALALGRALALTDREASADLLVRRALLDGVRDAALPAQADAERLRLHPLLQAEAAHRFASWPTTDQEAIHRALASWYADYTNTAPDLALNPDEANIIGALDWALAHHDDRATARICNGMRGFWRDTGRTRAGLRYLPLGAAAAGRIADETGEREDRRRQANISLYLGDFLRNVGRLAEAEDVYRQDLGLRRAIEDRQGEGVDLSNLGQVALSRGRLEEAAEYFAQSLVIRRETQDRQGEGADLSNLGQVALLRGRLEEAAEYFAQSLVIRRETQDRRGEGVVLSNLGRVAEARGAFAEAAQAYRDGIAALRDADDRINIATALEILGAVLLRQSDDRAGGVAAYAEAIALWQEMGLADRERQARERALGLGCREEELPPRRNAAR